MGDRTAKTEIHDVKLEFKAKMSQNMLGSRYTLNNDILEDFNLGKRKSKTKECFIRKNSLLDQEFFSQEKYNNCVKAKRDLENKIKIGITYLIIRRRESEIENDI